MLYLGGKPGDLPATEEASRENLAIPMWAGIAADLQERIVSVMRKAVAARSAA
jgi:dTDP-4-amino-4,6-dideoxygalactose transaminase